MLLRIGITVISNLSVAQMAAFRPVRTSHGYQRLQQTF
ncbi:hypothetical protein CPter91_5367 [Collimonas pratensis]|uniref:Uncharacterized protein n=1 Tax=Collimonas pratensis TaxID=279113 RepID=A0A127QC59_9BURK|nr:hypothetical protein CPter91_5367 [Collimonas pratensis]